MNNVSLVGRITKDPELRTIQNGNVVTTFTVAINRPFTNANGEREADFILVTAWRRLAENVVRYCGKGSLIGVTGRIQSRSYDADDGTRRYVTEVMADNVQFLATKKNLAGGYQTNNNYQDSKNNNMVDQGPTPADFAEPETTDISEDPFKDFGSEVVLSDDDLPF